MGKFWNLVNSKFIRLLRLLYVLQFTVKEFVSTVIVFDCHAVFIVIHLKVKDVGSVILKTFCRRIKQSKMEFKIKIKSKIKRLEKGKIK